MIRLFEQHQIRPVKELDGMWDFTMEGVAKRYRMPVPGCWEQHPDFLKRRGIGTYSREIYMPQPGNLRLEFKGVSHTADVFLDGELVAHHYNAFTPFAGIVTQVEKGVHMLTVQVDNTFSEASALHIPNDYYTYGGITRPVAMEMVPDVYIKGIHFTPRQEEGTWKARVEVSLENLSSQDRQVEIAGCLEPWRGGETGSGHGTGVTEGPDAGASDKAGKGCFRIAGYCREDWKIQGSAKVPAKGEYTLVLEGTFPEVETWSHESPRLYLLHTLLSLDGEVADDLTERVGFRTVALSGKQILVNGKKVFLKGFNRHEDYAVEGCAISLQHMVQDMDLMQDMHVNALRTCHYPNDERFLDLCDERGIMVWEENHARGLSLERMQNPNFERQCEDCIREMIQNHYNHPAIVIWGILNECASDTEEGRRMYKKQYKQIKSLDATRPTTSATCRHFRDLTLDLPDIVSFNQYSRWYEDCDIAERKDAEIQWIREAGGEGKPIIVSEFGAAAVYGYRDRTCCKWSEEYQAQLLRDSLEVYMQDPDISGVFIWQYSDCRVCEEDNWFATRARSHNNKGVVDEYRRPKMAYDVVKELFGKDDFKK